MGKLQPRSKLWISDESGKVMFGGGRHCILRAIDEHGSMNKAASELGMSFRTLWGRIRETEQRLGYKLVENRKSSRSGGSVLTEEGREILRRFEKFREEATNAVNVIFDRIFD